MGRNPYLFTAFFLYFILLIKFIFLYLCSG
nr:MAG TPA: hypothetical protein [Caudoviricetes sp.]